MRVNPTRVFVLRITTLALPHIPILTGGCCLFDLKCLLQGHEGQARVHWNRSSRKTKTWNMIDKWGQVVLRGGENASLCHEGHSHLQELAGYKTRVFASRSKSWDFYKCGHKNLTNYRDQHRAANRNTSCDYLHVWTSAKISQYFNRDGNHSGMWEFRDFSDFRLFCSSQTPLFRL